MSKVPSNMALKGKRLPVWTGLLLILAAGIIVYAQVYGFEFVYYDDDEYVTHNVLVTRGLTAESISWAFTATVSKHWHPVTWLSHMLDVELFGLNPAGHHLMNLGLHLITAMLLFRFLDRTTAERIPALLVALAFTLHPLHVENVAWVADRKDLLCALLWMVTLNLYAGYAKTPGFARYAAALMAFCLAALAKSTAVTLPLVLLLLDVWPLQRTARRPTPGPDSGQQAFYSGLGRLFVEKIPFFAVSVVTGLAALYILQSQYYHSPIKFPADAKYFIGMEAFMAYLAKLVFPIDLITPYPIVLPANHWKPVLIGLLTLLITTVIISLHRRHPYLLAGWGWYIVTLLPVVGFFGVVRPANRYAYLPFIGIYMLMVWGAIAAYRRWHHLKMPLLALAVIVLILWSGISWRQAGIWRNTRTLFGHTLTINPRSSVAHANIGAYLYASKRLDEAVWHQREAVRRTPLKPEYHYNLGVSLLKQGDYATALQHFNRATQLYPEYVNALSNKGACLLYLGEREAARRELERALQLEPDHAHTHNHLGYYHVQQGDLAAAESRFRKALSIDPQYSDALANLAGTLASKGAYGEAEQFYAKAIQNAPENPGYYFGLASLLAFQKRFAAAAEIRRQGLSRAPQDAEQHYFLAVDDYFAGNLRKARKHLARARSLGYDQVEREFEERLNPPPVRPDDSPEGGER